MITERRIARALVTLALTGLLAACTSGPYAAPASLRPLLDRESGPHGPFDLANAYGKIQHVVVVVQENRSFDNLFQGYPGADTVASGHNCSGATIALQPIGLEAPYDISHYSTDFQNAYDNGKMDCFDKEYVFGSAGPNAQYGYVPHAEIKPYLTMAHQYVLGDRMFTSHIDASFVSHQYIIAGQAGTSVNLPDQVWGCDGGPSD